MTQPVEAPQILSVAVEEAQEFFDVDQWAFAFDDSELDPAPAKAALPWGRTFGASFGDGLAGVYASFSFELTVPGGLVPGLPTSCGGLTWVGVHPQHRRRGVLTAMMLHHLQDVREHGEPVSALFAAEPAIYGRFGYGLASSGLALTIGRGAAFREVPGSRRVRVRFEKADADRHSSIVESCRDAARVNRPGEVSRPGAGMQRKAFDDQRARRRGAETLRIAIAEDADSGEVRGYALFRRTSDWSDGGPNGEVSVRELTAGDPAAAHALWSRLSDLDLMSRLSTDIRPVDDPLLSMLVDVRATTPRLTDNLWVRVVDVPAALTARRYRGDVDVVLDVSDPVFPTNSRRWHLRGGPDKAECEPTDDPADLSLDVRELGAVSLGGTTLTSLAGAGLVSAASAQALWRASSAFSSPVAPVCGFMF
jgi:predicted acetyltransferase